MAKPKVPSLQHLARHWKPTPQRVGRSLVQVAKNPPTFSYSPLFGAISDMLVLRVEYEQIVKGIAEGTKREEVRDNFLEILPLIRDYFEGLNPDFVQSVDRRFYAIGRGLLVPFDPPLIYSIGGQRYFPWLSFWRSNPLKDEALALFVTIVEEMLFEDPDLENAKFLILDFSAPSKRPKEPQNPRTLKTIDANSIPRVPDARKAEMLEIFAEGFLLAQAELENTASRSKGDQPNKGTPPDHPDLFD